MKHYKTMLLAAAAVAGLGLTARADTTVQNTTVSQVNLPNTVRVNFADFDLNHDGVLSTEEVGEKLFYLFDQDGNHVIDNIEYNKCSVLTIIPMKESTLSYHVDNDGTVDQKSYTQDSFTERSGLARFSNGKKCLTPREFLGNKGFNQVDVNKDGTIDINEWKGAYIGSIDRHNRELARYND